VLAAGRGERLRPLTDELPKPLLPVAGRPLAAWTLERLRAAGVEAAALNLHHRGEAIRAAFGASFRGLPLVYSEEPELLGTGGALPPLADFFVPADVVLLVNGDTLGRGPLARLLARHRRARRRGAVATLLFHRTVDPRPFGGGVALEGERVLAFRRGALAWGSARLRRVFAGAAALAPELIADLPPGPCDIVSALYEPLLAQGRELAAAETARAWHDLGTPERYLEGALAWALDGLPARGERRLSGAEVDPTARLVRSVVEAGARVGAGARLERTLVLSGARVGAGATLAHAIVGPGAEVAPGERLTHALRTAGGAVDRPLAAHSADSA
jgi:mannose-1-phosphate guanylyltransferase